MSFEHDFTFPYQVTDRCSPRDEACSDARIVDNRLRLFYSRHRDK